MDLMTFQLEAMEFLKEENSIDCVKYFQQRQNSFPVLWNAMDRFMKKSQQDPSTTPVSLTGTSQKRKRGCPAERPAQSQRLCWSTHTCLCCFTTYLRLPKRSNRRGCDRGLCCVYSMWNDPKWFNHRGCVHRCCRVSQWRFPVCGTPLFPLGVHEIDPTVRTRPNCGGSGPSSSHTDPRVLQTKGQFGCNGGENGHSHTQTSIPLDAPRGNNRMRTVARSAQAHGRHQRSRNARTVPIVQRVRKRMGQKRFGCL